jgi:hypothetical protein
MEALVPFHPILIWCPGSEIRVIKHTTFPANAGTHSSRGYRLSPEKRERGGRRTIKRISGAGL